MSSPKIKLLFDVSPLTNSRKSGVGFYTERLLHALATRYPNELHIVGHYFNFLDRKDVALPGYPNVEYRRTKYFPSKLINIMRRFGIEPPIELFLRYKGNFIIYPNFTSYPSLRHTPSAAVIHDLGYLDCPEYLQAPNRRFLERYVPRSLKRTRFTITISKVTQNALVKHYGIANDDFLITPIPVPATNVQPTQPKVVTGKFILFIGTLEPRKNFINLVRAYMLLPENVRNEYGLVLAGGTGWHVKQEMDEIEQLQNDGANITTTGYFSDSEKEWMLKNAALFVQPSHYEGFGMPILEAMDAGLPTLVSDIEIFHEVSDDASLFFDQDEPQSIADAISKVINDPELQQKLRKLGHEQTKKHDWNTIAEQLYLRICTEVKGRDPS